MNQSLKNEFLKQVEKYDSIIIHRHVNPDPDAIGSQLGLKEILKENFNKNVFAVGEESEGLNFLGTMDNVEDELFERSLCIILDTANEKRISDQRYINSPFVFKIDHHPDREPFGNASWVDTSFSSTCEMITHMFTKDETNFVIPDNSARLLFSGLIGDTGRFLYKNTSSETLAIGSLLKKFNFDANEIYTSLYTTTKKVVKAKAHLLSNFETTSNGVAYSIFTSEDIERLDVRTDEAANLVNEMSYIEDVPVWVLFVEDGSSFRVRIRSSKTEIDKVANKYNGGGHPLASGASVTKEQINSLLEDLNQLFD